MVLTPAAPAAAAVVTCVLLIGAVVLPRLLHRGSWAWARPRVALACWGSWVVLCTVTPLIAALGATSLVVQLAEALTGSATPARDVSVVGCAALVAVVVAAAGGRAGVLAVGLVRRRRRHAAVVELVGTWDPRWEVLVVPSAVPAAYALGAVAHRGTVVMTTAAMSITDDTERSVIIAHHRARSAWYLDVVVFVFTLWHDLLHRWRATRTAADDVATLVAMLADRAPARTAGVGAAIGALRRLESGLPGGCDEVEWTPRPATVRRVRHLLRSGAQPSSSR